MFMHVCQWNVVLVRPLNLWIEVKEGHKFYGESVVKMSFNKRSILFTKLHLLITLTFK